MLKLVFFAPPRTGHVNALSGFARKLQAAGHRVAFAAIPDFRDLLEGYGFEFLPLFADLFPVGYLRGQSNAGTQNALRQFADNMDHFKRYRIALERILESGLEALVRPLRPDVAVVDNWLPFVAWRLHSLQIPTALVHSALRWPTADAPTVRSDLTPALRLRRFLLRSAARLAPERRQLDRVIRRVAHQTGFAPDYLPVRRPAVDPRILEMILLPRDLEIPAEVEPGLHYIEGALDLNRPDHSDAARAFPWDRLRPDRRMVYCAMGTLAARYAPTALPGFFQAVVDAARGRPDCQLVLVVGPRLAAGLRNVPADAIVVSWAPQVELLKRAAAAIVHGGANSLRECVSIGVPMVTFPFAFTDQPEVGRRVVFHGLGVAGDVYRATEASVRPLLDRVLDDPSFQTRCAAMRDRVLAVEREQPGVRLVESLAAQPRVSSADT